MLIRTPAKNLEVLVNRVLTMDVEGRAALNSLAGRTLAVILDGTGYRLSLRITADGMVVDEGTAPDAEVTIKGTPAAFLGFLRGEKAATAGNIDISGDVSLAQDTQAILKNLDLDWEESLSVWIGDTLARKAGNLFRGAARFLAQTRRTLEADISEYLRYETEVLPDRAEIDEFNNAVDNLRDDAERLKVRITRLQRDRGR
jgi:ubiquinone biosynthesis protein UbiJ